MLFETTKQATRQFWKPVVETLIMICNRYGGDVHVSLAIRAKPSHFVARLVTKTSLEETRLKAALGRHMSRLRDAG
jgi:hypothetical protein